MDDTDAAAFFEAHGFVLQFTWNTIDEMRAVYVDRGTMRTGNFYRAVKRGEIGPVFANLHATDGRLIWPVFGTGQTERDAAASAVERWRTQRP